jgi:hypothetical protein
MGMGGPEELIAGRAIQDASKNIEAGIQASRFNANAAMPADTNSVAASTMARIASMFTPGGRLREAPSAMARRVANLLFDNSWGTKESAASPLTNRVAPTAESLKGIHDAKLNEAQISMRESLKEGVRAGGFTHQLQGAESIAIKSTSDNAAFGRAVVDHLWREDAHARGFGEAPQSHPSVTKAAKAMRAYLNHMDGERLSLELPGSVKNYVPRQYKSWEVMANREDFITKLIEQQRDNTIRDFNTGEWKMSSNRVVENGVWDGPTSHLTAKDVEAIRSHLEAKGASELTEAELANILDAYGMSRYEKELQAFWRSRAEATFDTITKQGEMLGTDRISHASRPMRERSMDLDPVRFRRYLHDESDHLLNAYHHSTAGHLAARRSFRMDDAMRIEVKRLTGKNAADENFDPALLLEAVDAHFQGLIDAANGDTRSIDALRNAKTSVSNDLRAKMNELLGNNMVEQPIGWALLGQRVSLRMPVMAYLGNLVASNISDIAAMSLMSKMTANQRWQLIKSLNLFKEVPKSGLESLFVGTMDAANNLRAARGMGLNEMPMGAAYGHGTQANVMQAIDKVTEKGTAKFLGLTGMVRFNNNLRRAFGHVILEQLTDGARKMAQAEVLRRGGMSEADAIARVGITAEDAATFNRLGINGRTATDIVLELKNHATDVNGGALGSRVDTHDGFIHPQFEKWADKDSARILMSAVSRHTTDIIIDPKLLSKPLINRTWHGKIFNQMANFFYAWGNQQAVLAAQRPATAQAQYVMLAVGLGAAADALHNVMSGRRSLDETAQKWADDPLAMTYGAIDRSALLGWLSRPIALADKENLGPNRFIKNEQMSGTFRQADGPWEIMGGPFASWAKSLTAGVAGLANGNFGPSQRRQLWNATPYHNLWFINSGLRAMEAAGFETPEFTHPKKR